MMTRLACALAALPALASTGCYLYSDDDCQYGDVLVDSASLRNPDTGLCEYFEVWTGSGTCGERPPDYADREQPAGGEALPDWGQCTGACDGLDELGCLATAGCRAAYLGDCAEDYDCAGASFLYFGCWQVAPSGPVQGGGCAGLDAYQCSRHDDCSARHYPAGGCVGEGCDAALVPELAVGRFLSCADEGVAPLGCFDDYECPEGQRCNAAEICLPSPYGCDGTTDPSDGLEVPCDERCYGYCVPGEPVDPEDPGECYAEVWCDGLAPACPDGTLPGVIDGCWSGYCIPLAACEPQAACAELADEVACVARPDCAPIYQGIDCTCDEGGCVCADWLYQRCEPADPVELGCGDDQDCAPGELCCYPCGVPGCAFQCMAPDAAGQCPMVP